MMASKKSQEEAVQQFQRLRQEQRSMATKLSELQMDLNEHKLVIETLSDVEADRKCFRMVGGVLVERTVKEVLPSLETNKDKLSKLIQTLDTQLSDKGKEINGHMEKHNISLRSGNAPTKDSSDNKASAENKGTSGVLVSAAGDEKS